MTFSRFALPAIFFIAPLIASATDESGIIPWVEANSAPPAPIGTIDHSDGAPLASIAAGWTSKDLVLRIDVHDKDHVPAPDQRRLWSADSIEIGIDAAGDGSGDLPANTTGPIRIDDLKLIFGLLETGPSVNVLASETKPDLDLLLAGTRIDHHPDKGTVYELTIPWTVLNVAGGARPVIGLDVQVNDRDPGENDKTTYQMGEGLKQGFTAATLPRFTLGAPDDGFIALDWANTVAWSDADSIELTVGLRSDDPFEVTLTMDNQSVSVTVPGGSGFQHTTLTFPSVRDGATLTATADGVSPVIATQTAAAGLYRQLQDRLADLLARPDQHPIFVRHLRSLSALAATDWGRVQLQKTANPRRAIASLGYYRDLLSGLNADAADWAAYLDGRRSLVMAYVSPHDQSTQFYWLGLPREWDPTETYPLFFELHGAGNDHPMSGLANRLAATAKRHDGHGYDSPKVYAEIDRAGYWVHPWGRGNLSYQGVARIDVLEAYDDIHQMVSIDPNRRYLYGFSMGGQGTFTLGSRTPSRWAAACSIAPRLSQETAQSPLTANWELLPYKLMTGEEDRLFPFYHQILDGMAQHGIEPEARSIPGLGHRYLAELQREKMDWLKTHVRYRPSSFRFVTDDNLTNTCWGVSLILPPDASEPASVDVRIEGQIVHVNTEGTERILIDPSEPDGLGLRGDITVNWNGTTAYEGPAQHLDLKRDTL